jgi:hypothetical protein
LIAPEVSGKIFYLAQDGLGVWDWSEKVYNFVEGLGQDDSLQTG